MAQTTAMRSVFLGSSSRVAVRTTPVRMFAQRLQRVTRRGMVVKVCGLCVQRGTAMRAACLVAGCTQRPVFAAPSTLEYPAI